MKGLIFWWACVFIFVGAVAVYASRLEGRDLVETIYDQKSGVLCVRSTVGRSHSISCVRYVPGTAL